MSRIALVTGGTRGIGKAIADLFIVNEANVILTGSKKKEINLLGTFDG